MTLLYSIKHFVVDESVQPALVLALCCATGKHPLCEPLEHPACGAVFCRGCQVGKSLVTMCPKCFVPLNADNHASADARLSQMVELLDGSCPHCNMSPLKFGAFAHHLANDCIQPCVRGCGRLVQTSHAAQVSHFGESCPRVFASCVNEGCGLSVACMSLSNHMQNECGWRKVRCKGASFSCHVRCLARNLAVHEAKCPSVAIMARLDMVDALTAANKELTVANEALKKEVQALRKSTHLSMFASVAVDTASSVSSVDGEQERNVESMLD
jgi:hypothetical protein